MSNLSIIDLQQIYSRVKDLARNTLQKGEWNKALNRINLAAHIGYRFNFIFTDSNYEEMLNVLSKNIISKQSNYTPCKDRFIFYDSFGFSNRGLAHQYIRALKSWGVEFLYIFGTYNPQKSKILLDEIKSYSKAEIFILDTSAKYNIQIQTLYEIVSTYKPQKAFLYLTPWDVVALTTFNAVPQLTKYQINLTDHAFWLGIGCINYSIEFRNYGYTISLQKRGMPENKLLIQPFYPIKIPLKFMGFPNEVTPDKVVIFSGGAYYKIDGDNDKFFYLLKRILDENLKAIILFAGWGEDKPIKEFIKKNRYEKRLVLLGFRSDINEIFAFCDIYLGTYPMSGGLMSQYAASNAKPILAYGSSRSIGGGYVEDFVLHNSQKSDLKITHTDLEDFFEEANKLINNKEYRERVGQLIQGLIITPEQFNFELHQLIETHKNIRKIKELDINYQIQIEQNAEIQNKYQHSLAAILLKKLHLSAIWLFSSLILRNIPHIFFSYFYKRIKRFVIF